MPAHLIDGKRITSEIEQASKKAIGPSEMPSTTEKPNPDFDWYARRSKTLGLSPRCPIARAELCPRYYSSYWLLGKAGITTAISEEDQARLDRRWAPFKPVVSEEEPGVSHSDGAFSSVNNFCPEVAYETFGYFASSLWRYADETDAGRAHEALRAEGVGVEDPRWHWASCKPRHYSECKEFSLYLGISGSVSAKRRSPKRQGLSSRLRWTVFARDEFKCQYCGRKPPDVELEVDHKTSVADGGGNEVQNLATSCLQCNRGKGARSR